MKEKWQPTIKQANFVDNLLAGLNIRESAEAAGCSRFTYHKRWSKNADFLAFLEKRRREEAGAKLPKIDQKLFEKAAEGDTAAMRLVYEVFGGLREPKLEINVPYSEPEHIAPGAKVLSLLDSLEKKQKADASE